MIGEPLRVRGMRGKSRNQPELFQDAAWSQSSANCLSEHSFFLVVCFTDRIKNLERTWASRKLLSILDRISWAGRISHFRGGRASCFGVFFPFFARSQLHSRSWSWQGAAAQLQQLQRGPEVAPAQAPQAPSADRRVTPRRDATVRDMDITTEMAR